MKDTKLETIDNKLDFSLSLSDNFVTLKRSGSNYGDKIYNFGYTGSKTKFDLVAKSEQASDKIRKLAKEEQDNKSRGLTFIKKSQFDELQNEINAKSETISILGEFEKDSQVYVALLLKDRISDIVVNYDGKGADLELWRGFTQEGELFVWETPSKWLKSDQKKVYFAQGPNFIGIHANAKEDLGVKLFARFLSSNEKYNISGEISGRTFNYSNITPSEFMTRQAGYIAPIKGFEDIDFQNNDELNPAVKLAAEIYKRAITNPSEYQLFEEYGDSRTESFRTSIDGAFRGANTAARKGKEIGSYKEAIIDIVVNSNQSIFKKEG